MKERYLRADTKGRVWTPRERREQLLDEFAQTGVSAAAFARMVGVRYSTFAAWVNRRKKESGVNMASRSEKSLVRFVEAMPTAGVISGPSEEGLRVELPGRARIEIRTAHEVELAAALLCALERKGTPGC